MSLLTRGWLVGSIAGSSVGWLVTRNSPDMTDLHDEILAAPDELILGVDNGLQEAQVLKTQCDS